MDRQKSKAGGGKGGGSQGLDYGAFDVSALPLSQHLNAPL